jgi:hypothetical protein
VWSAVSHKMSFILSRVWVNMDGIWIGNRMYWTLCIQRVTTVYTHSVHSHVFTSRCSVAASNGGRTPSSRFPNYPHTSAISFSAHKDWTAAFL